jgi:hypothetical protein
VTCNSATKIEVYVKNLDLWLRDIDKLKLSALRAGTVDPERDLPFQGQALQALVSKNVSNSAC